MKNSKIGLAIVFALATMAIFSSCKNPCKDLVCNFGKCQDGECICNHGYFATTCTDTLNVKFKGVYILEEECGFTGIDNYTISLTPSFDDLARVNIINLYRLDSTDIIPMDISPEGTNVSIAVSPVHDGTIETTSKGTTNVTGTSINFTYKFKGTTSGLVDVCAAYLTKQ